MTMRIVTNFDEACTVLLNIINKYSEEEVRQLRDQSGSDVNTIVRVLRRYRAAQDAAGNFGLIGVGAITFAQDRMQRFQKRAGIAFNF